MSTVTGFGEGVKTPRGTPSIQQYQGGGEAAAGAAQPKQPSATGFAEGLKSPDGTPSILQYQGGGNAPNPGPQPSPTTFREAMNEPLDGYPGGGSRPAVEGEAQSPRIEIKGACSCCVVS